MLSLCSLTLIWCRSRQDLATRRPAAPLRNSNDLSRREMAARHELSHRRGEYLHEAVIAVLIVDESLSLYVHAQWRELFYGTT